MHLSPLLGTHPPISVAAVRERYQGITHPSQSILETCFQRLSKFIVQYWLHLGQECFDRWGSGRINNVHAGQRKEDERKNHVQSQQSNAHQNAEHKKEDNEEALEKLCIELGSAVRAIFRYVFHFLMVIMCSLSRRVHSSLQMKWISQYTNRGIFRWPKKAKKK